MGAHDPREWGYKATCQHGTTIPGYWPDEPRQHGNEMRILFYADIVPSFLHCFQLSCLQI